MTKMGRQEETRLSGPALVDFPGQDLALRCKCVNPKRKATGRHTAYPNHRRLPPKDIPTARGPAAFQVLHLQSSVEEYPRLWR